MLGVVACSACGRRAPRRALQPLGILALALLGGVILVAASNALADIQPDGLSDEVETRVCEAFSNIGDKNWREQIQLRLPDQPPLQFFPRLTTPAFVRRRLINRHGVWILPIFFRSDREVVGGRANGFLDPRESLSFWLERARPKTDEAPPQLEEVAANAEERVWVRDVEGGITDTPIQGGALVLYDDWDHPGFAGYYWLRIVPKIGPVGDSKPASKFRSAIREGSLGRIMSGASDAEFLPGPSEIEDMDWLVDALDCHTSFLINKITCRHSFKHFWPSMAQLQGAASAHRDCLKRHGGSACGDTRAGVLASLRSLFGEDRSPAGVFFDTGEATKDFTYVIGGDIQEGGRISRFTRMLDEVAFEGPTAVGASVLASKTCSFSQTAGS